MNQLDGDQSYVNEALGYPVPTGVPWTTRLSRPLRLKLFITGVVFPLICLGFIVSGSVASLNVPWQSGRFHDHVAVFLSYPTISAFFPLLIFNFISMTVWCYRPNTLRFALIRVGIYSGAVVALIFNCLLTFTAVFLPWVFALIVAPILALVVWGLGWLRQYFFRKRFSILYLFVLTTVCSVALAFAIPWLKTEPRIWEYVMAPLLLIMGGAAPLGLVTFARCSRAIYRLECQLADRIGSTSFGWKRMLPAWILWAIGMMTALKYALEMEAAEYAKLPVTDPNCYVSSAAAHGHRGFVGAAKRADGFFVNLQMKRLKFMELALAVSFPKAHQLVREIYNRIGPKLAKFCKANRCFADMTYVLLKPLELLAVFVRRASGVSNDVIAGLYE